MECIIALVLVVVVFGPFMIWWINYNDRRSVERCRDAYR